MSIGLGEHFTYNKLLRFVLPSVIMMIFTSIYGVVDGLFISNFVGKTAFAAVNFIMPVTMGMSAVGFMIGAGGSALVAKTLGEGDNAKANRYFSLFLYFTIGCGIVLTVLGQIFIRPLAIVMGATADMLEPAVTYGRILMCSVTAFMVQNFFQTFFVTAEKPKLGLYVIVLAGVTNMVLDALFVALFKWGVVGAALATATSQVVGAVVPVAYFAGKNDSLLKLGKTKWCGKAIAKAVTNGSSELLTNISMSVVNILYNAQLLRYIGENGVAAYGAIMYVNFIFIAIFLGYSMGSAPLFGFNFGAQNKKELKNLFKKSFVVIAVLGATLFGVAFVSSGILSQIFVGYDAELFELTKHAFRIYALSFLFNGFNIFASAFFTALNNGLVSAILSFLRMFLFQVVCVFALPAIFGIEGIWFSVSVAELLCLFVSVAFILKNRNKYGYM
ncbi:MAG: MATE family efflux transporter [Clostridia bacterium]|nr:MATE family efflux transporter [Clostridia bacterium]